MTRARVTAALLDRIDGPTLAVGRAAGDAERTAWRATVPSTVTHWHAPGQSRRAYMSFLQCAMCSTPKEVSTRRSNTRELFTTLGMRSHTPPTKVIISAITVAFQMLRWDYLRSGSKTNKKTWLCRDSSSPQLPHPPAPTTSPADAPTSARPGGHGTSDSHLLSKSIATEHHSASSLALDEGVQVAVVRPPPQWCTGTRSEAGRGSSRQWRRRVSAVARSSGSGACLRQGAVAAESGGYE